MVFLFVFPWLTAASPDRARQGHERAGRRAARQEQTDAYIREAAGRSPAQEIADAKALLDSGSITQAEFDSLKAKALS